MTNTPAARGRTATPGLQTPLEWFAGTGAFLVEIALAVTVAAAAYRAAGRGAGGWIAAIVALTLLIAIWARWMSPNAGHRLPVAGRLMLGTALTLLAAAAIFLTGQHLWGILLAVIGVAVTVVAQVMLES